VFLSHFASFRNVITSGFAALSIKLRLIAALWQAPATFWALQRPPLPYVDKSNLLLQDRRGGYAAVVNGWRK
jgi:hypothetical protein